MVSVPIMPHFMGFCPTMSTTLATLAVFQPAITTKNVANTSNISNKTLMNNFRVAGLGLLTIGSQGRDSRPKSRLEISP